MLSPYQEFVKRARERFAAREKRKESVGVRYRFTEHARFKMKQYSVSEQRALRVLRSPSRTEVGIAPHTVACMQPSSTRRGKDGKTIWNQEIWVMYTHPPSFGEAIGSPDLGPQSPPVRIISVWRYPGVSPKRNPIPEDILRELSERSTIEDKGDSAT